jgi:perosamine synthetase
MQCALGLSQLKKLPGWIKRRNEIAATYDAAFSLMKEKLKVVGHGSCSLINDKLLGKGSLQEPSNSSTQQLINQTTVHGRHLYPIRVPAERRSDIFAKLRAKGIGVNVHYIPIHLHPYYRETLGTGPGDCPVAEQAYEELISLPMYPGMMDEEVETVISTVMKYIRAE